MRRMVVREEQAIEIVVFSTVVLIALPFDEPPNLYNVVVLLIVIVNP